MSCNFFGETFTMYLYDDPIFFDSWYFVVHGIYQWFLTHSHFRIFFPFWENGAYVSINDQLLYIYKGRNNDVLSQFWWNLIVKFKMEEIMVGL